MRLRLVWLGILFLFVAKTGSIGAAESSQVGADEKTDQQAIADYYKGHAELPREGGGPWIELIGRGGGPEELRKLYDQVARGGFDAAAVVRALDILADAARVRHVVPTPTPQPVNPVVDPDYQTLLRLLGASNTKIQAAAARLAGAWHMEYLGEQLATLAASPDAEVRVAAFDALRAIGGKTALTFFAVLVRPNQRAETRRHALVAIAEIQLDAAVVQAANVLPAIDTEADALETWRGLLKVDRAAAAFAVRLPRELPLHVLTAGLKASQELGKTGEPLTKALKSRLKPKRED